MSNYELLVPAHKHERQRKRLLKQIRDGKLKGAVVTSAARYAAHGLVSPDQLQLIMDPKNVK